MDSKTVKLKLISKKKNWSIPLKYSNERTGNDVEKGQKDQKMPQAGLKLVLLHASLL